MTESQKIKTIVDWYAQQYPDRAVGMKEQNVSDKLEGILDGEDISSLKEIYSNFNGESSKEGVSFLGHSFLSTTQLNRVIQNAKKDEEKQKVKTDVDVSTLHQKVVDFVIPFVPTKRKFGIFNLNWSKVEFDTSPMSFGGPYVYYKKNEPRDIFKITEEAHSSVMEITRQIWELNQSLKDGDEIYYEVKYDGTFSTRIDDFDSHMSFTSTPTDYIKLVYKSSKWIPLITDNGGNYIGLDYDPDTNGVKGQVITFGRDEDNHLVLANSLNEFLDMVINMTKNSSEELLSDLHLHEIFKRKTAANN